jgi:hypothetical protein
MSKNIYDFSDVSCRILLNFNEVDHMSFQPLTTGNYKAKIAIAYYSLEEEIHLVFDTVERANSVWRQLEEQFYRHHDKNLK